MSLLLLLLLEYQNLLLELLLLLVGQFYLSLPIHLNDLSYLLVTHVLRKFNLWCCRHLDLLKHLLITTKRLIVLTWNLSPTNLRWTAHLTLVETILTVYGPWHPGAIHDLIMLLLDEGILLLLFLLELPSILFIPLLNQLLNEVHQPLLALFRNVLHLDVWLQGVHYIFVASV